VAIQKELRAIQFAATARVVGDRTIARLPAEASSALPSRGQVAVSGHANGHPFDTVIEPDGLRGHYIAIDDDLVIATGIVDSDVVAFELEPARVWPEPDVPTDLRAALDGAPDIAGSWQEITPMARWEWVRWVNATANPATRDRRVEVSISKLRNGMRRPCCFDLSSCTDPELSKSGKLAIS
jgi:hypothetical protein